MILKPLSAGLGDKKSTERFEKSSWKSVTSEMVCGRFWKLAISSSCISDLKVTKKIEIETDLQKRRILSWFRK